MAGEMSFFSVGVAEVARAKGFYGGLLGWTFEDTAGGAVISGAGCPGGVHGGDEGASPYVFFRVDDLDAALSRVAELGGTREPLGDEHEGGGEEEEVARFGRFALCRDDQGSRFGLHEPPPG